MARACFSGMVVNRIPPIPIGPLTLAMPVILAPMTGVTDRPFRTLVKRYGAGLTVTEMIASADVFGAMRSPNAQTPKVKIGIDTTS